MSDEKDREIADLKEQLAAARANAKPSDDAGDVRERAVAEAEARDAMQPVPTQAELDSVKLKIDGAQAEEAGKPNNYRTRQSKA